MGARVIGAVAVAAVVATVVTIAAQGPSADGLAIVENAGAAVRPSRASVQADVSSASVQASQATQIPSASARSGPANWPQDETPVTGPPPTEAVQKSQRIGLLDPATATPPAMVAPKARAADSLTREEMASMLKRGQDMIAAGDVAGARLILFRVSEAGNAEASLTLARTFDAGVLAKLNVVGARPDAAKARALYAKAAEQGSIEAQRRLDQSNR
jgi:TPR repeat protein